LQIDTSLPTISLATESLCLPQKLQLSRVSGVFIYDLIV
jgi:hypothetical protein